MDEQFGVGTQGQESPSLEQGMNSPVASQTINQTPIQPQVQNITQQPPPKRKNILLPLFVFLIVIAGAVGGSYYFLKSQKDGGTQMPSPTPGAAKIELSKFASEEEFKNYLAESEVSLFGGIASSGLGLETPVATREDVSLQTLQEGAPGGGAPVERVSGTNVQVVGIDEPDIVKTDGQTIFFSSIFSRFYPLEIFSSEQTVGAISHDFIPPVPLADTKIIKAFPPTALAKMTSIEKNGDLLLNNKTLIIFSGTQIFAYDVTDPANPQEKWNQDFDSNVQIVASRLYDGKIYIVTSTTINSLNPCPIPLTLGVGAISIPCIDVYYPRGPMSVDSTYTALTIDTQSGEIKNKVSFVGSSTTSVVYMSPNALYITYTQYKAITKIFYDFFNEKGKDLLSAETLERLKKLNDYDISLSAKFTELQVILQNYYNSLGADDRLRIENEVANRLSQYVKERARELETTGIAKIGTQELNILSTGEVPGRPLNQFSLDEYENNLRIATTTSGGLFGGGESVNDVYVLGGDMQRLGAVTDLGKGERIYSVRFIDDKGYVVTFRQIDPFYVLDLSTPANPIVKGELKIPGYSSYLHPITKDKILGVGQEGSQVKVSLFDVGNPQNPTEVGKYLLDEFWSDILDTHHAFLLDDRHEVFFLPGSKGGYIFSYKDNVISLVKAVADISARRAIYINDYMYIVGDDKVVVLNEADWEKVNELSF